MFKQILLIVASMRLAQAGLHQSGRSAQSIVRHDGPHHSGPKHETWIKPGPHDDYAVPNYHFAYLVADGHTGDHKSQHESRHADQVKGGYTVVEPDGNVRSVHYSADDHTGFHATVHHSSPHHHIYFQN